MFSSRIQLPPSSEYLAHLLIYGWTYDESPRTVESLLPVYLALKILLSIGAGNRFGNVHFSNCEAEYPLRFCKRLSLFLREAEPNWPENYLLSLLDVLKILLESRSAKQLMEVVLPEGHSIVISLTIACKRHMCSSRISEPAARKIVLSSVTVIL